MACYIFGAGGFYGLPQRPAAGDTVIAADGGWRICRRENITPDLLLGDFDSLHTMPDFARIRRVPVEKDDTDMMLAIKEGLGRGETEFHLYGGMGGRTDHTIANLQGLLYLADHGARGWLYGDRERFTAIRDGSITLPAREKGHRVRVLHGRGRSGRHHRGRPVHGARCGADIVISSGCQQSLCGQSCPRHRDAGQFADSIDRKGVNKHEKERTE